MYECRCIEPSPSKLFPAAVHGCAMRQWLWPVSFSPLWAVDPGFHVRVGKILVPVQSELRLLPYVYAGVEGERVWKGESESCNPGHQIVQPYW